MTTTQRTVRTTDETRRQIQGLGQARDAVVATIGEPPEDGLVERLDPLRRTDADGECDPDHEDDAEERPPSGASPPPSAGAGGAPDGLRWISASAGRGCLSDDPLSVGALIVGSVVEGKAQLSPSVAAPMSVMPRQGRQSRRGDAASDDGRVRELPGERPARRTGHPGPRPRRLMAAGSEDRRGTSDPSWWKALLTALAALLGAVVAWGWLRPTPPLAPVEEGQAPAPDSLSPIEATDTPADATSPSYVSEAVAIDDRRPPAWVRPTILWTLGVVVAHRVGGQSPRSLARSHHLPGPRPVLLIRDGARGELRASAMALEAGHHDRAAPRSGHAAGAARDPHLHPHGGEGCSGDRGPGLGGRRRVLHVGVGQARPRRLDGVPPERSP